MKKEKIALALQGGGAHGAFTWGVMEKLLEEDILDIRGLSGTSVGAINATMIVHGLQKNGNLGAIEQMEKFWKEISLVSTFIMPQPTWIDNNLFQGNMDLSPSYQTFSHLKGYLSPYQFNPMNINPLGDVLAKLVDFDELRESNVQLFIAATNINKGALKIFSLEDMSLNALLASAALPDISHAIEVDGEFYWDGGYTGNPPIYPLICGTDATDTLLIQINPIWSKKIPKSIDDIADRVNEITFNESLKAEMRMILRGIELEGVYKDNYFHLISPGDFMDDLNYSSKINTSWEFLNRLREIGRKIAQKWIEEELKFVGKKTSEEITTLFGYIEEDWRRERIHKPAKLLQKKTIGKAKAQTAKTY